MKILFIGTPEFGAIILEELCKTSFKPALVITETDKPVGRKQIVTPPPVKLVAEKYGISISQPENIRNLELKIRNLKPDLGIVAAYGQILPKGILDIPKFGFLNVHPSLLPRWRGPSPIQYAILNGDEETGVTIMLVDEKMDHGPIVANSKFQISNSKKTYPELHKSLAELGGELLVKTIPKWTNNEIKPKPQDDAEATYTKIIKKSDGCIDWKKTAEYIDRQVRAFNPWPGAYAFYGNKILKIIKAKVLRQTARGPFGPPGKTFLAPNDEIAVQTGENFFIIEVLQIEGKKPMSSGDFIRGHQDFIGNILQ